MTDQNQEAAQPVEAETSTGLTVDQYLNKIVQTTADMLGILEIEQSGMDRFRETNGELEALALQGKFFLFVAWLTEMQMQAQQALEQRKPKPAILTAGNILGKDGKPINLRETGRKKGKK